MRQITARQCSAADDIVNLTIVVTTIWAVVMYFIGEPDLLGSHDIQCFKYFTTDSNILAAMGSLLFLSFRFLRGKENPPPRWLTVFKFMGTVAATVTLLTVVFFLAPVAAVRGKGMQTVLLFFKGNVFVLHFSTPVLAILSTLLLEKDAAITWKQALWGTVPTTVYGLIYLIMVVFLKQWNDWYGFTFGGQFQFVPVVMIVMFLFSLGLSMAEQKIQNHRIDRCA